VLVIISLLIGCQSKKSEPYISFKDDKGNTILTDLDLDSMKVISLLDTNNRGFYIEFKKESQLEEITKQNLNRTIQIYYKDELVFSSSIEHIIRGNNLVFDDMEEEALKRLEVILQENK